MALPPRQSPFRSGADSITREQITPGLTIGYDNQTGVRKYITFHDPDGGIGIISFNSKGDPEKDVTFDPGVWEEFMRNVTSGTPFYDGPPTLG